MFRSSAKSQTSFSLFESHTRTGTLTPTTHNVTNRKRKLIEDGNDEQVGTSFSISHLKILPGASDLEKFNMSDPELIKEESRLKHLTLRSNYYNKDDEKHLPEIDLAGEITTIEVKEDTLAKEIQTGEEKHGKDLDDVKEELREIHAQQLKEIQERDKVYAQEMKKMQEQDEKHEKELKEMHAREMKEIQKRDKVHAQEMKEMQERNEKHEKELKEMYIKEVMEVKKHNDKIFIEVSSIALICVCITTCAAATLFRMRN